MGDAKVGEAKTKGLKASFAKLWPDQRPDH